MEAKKLQDEELRHSFRNGPVAGDETVKSERIMNRTQLLNDRWPSKTVGRRR